MPSASCSRPVLSITAAAVLALIVAACGAGPSATPSEAAPSSGAPSATPGPVAIADLAHAVVQIVTFVDDSPDALGSGTIISPDGLILTNAHVVTPDEGILGRVEIGLTEDSDTPPEPTYLADVAAIDGALDLAILRITERIDGGAAPDDLPYAEPGDSESLEIGDQLRILGYPGIGGETITLTSGLVSGFVGEAGLGERAWVKTDATIAGGNSGGLAANADGLLVAVPTIASAGGDVGEIVDCRPVRDTNRDGQINDDDDCVPLGGFLNGLRPIALALDMVDAVESGVAYEAIGPGETDVEPGDLAEVEWGDPIFGEGVADDDLPVGEAIGFATGITSLCAFWDYEGMEPGMRWSAEWTVDGALNEDVSFLDEVWSLEESGSFWVCADDDSGLPAGLYDVALIIEDEFYAGGFAHIGDDLKTASVTIRNTSAEDVCLVFVSPVAATVWGPDRLGPSDLLESGDEISFELIADEYEVMGADCEAETIFEEPADLADGGSIVLTWSGTELLGGAPTAQEDALSVGDCITGDIGWTTANTDVVSCDTPHEHQIVGIAPYAAADDAFPGDDALRQLGDERCYAAFESFVGIAYDRSIWYMTAWRPTADTWSEGDRTVICALHEENSEPITGSKEGVGE